MKYFPQLARGGEPLVLSPGIHPAMQREEYDRIPAFSQSLLKKWLNLATHKDDLHRCPARFKDWFDHREEFQPTPEMVMGSALDCWMLETGDFESKFAVCPADAPSRPSSRTLNAEKPSAKSLAAIQWWEAFNATNAGKRNLTAVEFSQVQGMARAVMADPHAASAFKHCRKAVIVSEIAGYMVKCEFDLFSEFSDTLCDLKSSSDVSDEGFLRLASKLGYNGQAGWYLNLARACGLDKRRFAFIAVETESPHWVNTPTLHLEDEVVQYGYQRLVKAMDALAEHLESDEWPSYSGFRHVAFPRWAENEAHFGLEAA